MKEQFITEIEHAVTDNLEGKPLPKHIRDEEKINLLETIEKAAEIYKTLKMQGA